MRVEGPSHTRANAIAARIEWVVRMAVLLGLRTPAVSRSGVGIATWTALRVRMSQNVRTIASYLYLALGRPEGKHLQRPSLRVPSDPIWAGTAPHQPH